MHFFFMKVPRIYLFRLAQAAIDIGSSSQADSHEGVLA